MLEDASKLMLRYKIMAKDTLNAFEKHNTYNPAEDTMCFSFELSIFIHEAGVSHLNDK